MSSHPSLDRLLLSQLCTSGQREVGVSRIPIRTNMSAYVSEPCHPAVVNRAQNAALSIWEFRVEIAVLRLLF